jgi:hypothetical protein
LNEEKDFSCAVASRARGRGVSGGCWKLSVGAKQVSARSAPWLSLLVHLQVAGPIVTVDPTATTVVLHQSGEAPPCSVRFTKRGEH